ncbi:DUF3450 domain-containing protein [Vibrio sp. DW001]|uniref:DUF3450 domain-containing protein n=1 Tax=Vibrio sp. DW001 TaxID=2912315 RepID=UPI0023B1138F|nr:DUF3450 domain-containing protein [Vibrio sp. DW001]WED28963.1 DUF3450 domain-containing protein [Vibrio sp. DW001]
MNKHVNKMRLKSITVLGLMAVIGFVNAGSLAESAKVEQAIIKDAGRSQHVVNDSSEHAFDLQSEIESLKAEVDGLAIYEDHLGNLILSQDQELTSVESQLDEIAETRQSIVPLMYQMLDGLATYIERDMPIRLDTRVDRVKQLRQLMVQADISDAEKFRRILEAYQIELDYVSKLGTYTNAIEINGVVREVEQLYLGHVSFIARSLDKKEYWVWSAQEKTWHLLNSALISDLDNAFLVANKRVSPRLLLLPLSTQEVSK